MELRFVDELPPGAHVVGSENTPRGISKVEVEKNLRATPGKWFLVYENTSHKTAMDWSKRPGFEAAHEALKNQEGLNSGNKRYKVWVRYVGVEGGEPEQPTTITQTGLPVQAPDAESRPVNPVAPAPSTPGPLSPGAVAAPPRTAFEQAFATGETSSQEIVS